MVFSNYKNLKKENSSRLFKLFRIMLYGSIAVIILLILLILWVTQPLLSKAEITKKEIKIDEQILETHVRKLSEEFHPRNFANTDKLNEAADYIKSEFARTGGTVSEQTFKSGKKDYRNIVVSYGVETEERIVIGAHYDSCFDTPGADDNASGVAGLIELAKLFGNHEPNMQIELVAYTLEEPPFFSTEKMGSFVHAKSLRDKNVDVRLMISLEMIGFFSDEPNSQKFPVPFMSLIYPNKGNFVSIVGNFTNIRTIRKIKGTMSASNDLPVYSINAPAKLPGIDFSDHKNYWNFGYDAIMITDTAFYRNEKYHTLEDTAEKLDYNRMAKVVEATYYAVKDLEKE